MPYTRWPTPRAHARTKGGVVGIGVCVSGGAGERRAWIERRLGARCGDYWAVAWGRAREVGGSWSWCSCYARRKCIG